MQKTQEVSRHVIPLVITSSTVAFEFGRSSSINCVIKLSPHEDCIVGTLMSEMLAFRILGLELSPSTAINPPPLKVSLLPYPTLRCYTDGV